MNGRIKELEWFLTRQKGASNFIEVGARLVGFWIAEAFRRVSFEGPPAYKSC